MKNPEEDILEEFMKDHGHNLLMNGYDLYEVEAFAEAYRATPSLYSRRLSSYIIHGYLPSPLITAILERRIEDAVAIFGEDLGGDLSARPGVADIIDLVEAVVPQKIRGSPEIVSTHVDAMELKRISRLMKVYESFALDDNA
jgi:hypothetical protein